MGPIEQLVQERLPPERAETVQAFAQAYLRRLAAAGDDDGHDTGGPLPRGPGRLRARGLARRRPDGGAGLQPDPRRARLRARRLGPRDQHRGPAVPRRLGHRRARRRAAWASCACCTRSSAPSARPTAASPASCIPAARRRPSRSCTSSSTGAWRPRTWPTSRTRCARCWPTCAAWCATSRSCASASSPSSTSRATGAARYEERRGGRGRRLPRVAGARQLHLPRRARLRAGRRRPARRGGLRPGAARRRGALGLRQAGGGRDARPEPARARAGRRAAAGLQDEPAVAGAPPRAHGLRRHPPRLGRRRDRRRGADDRALHDQGLRRARLRDARPAPQAAADPGQRGPDRRLARLQGGGLALRVLPQGRALRRAHRGPARRGGRAAGAAGRAGARARAAATRTGAPRRSSSRCPRAATTRRCSSACAPSCAGASTPARSTPTRC